MIRILEAKCVFHDDSSFLRDLFLVTVMSVSIANGKKKDEKDILLCEKITKTKIKGKSALPPVAKNSLYKTQLCRNYMSTGKCKYGRVCQFAHGKKELEKYSFIVCYA